MTGTWSLEQPMQVVVWKYLMPLGKIAYSPVQSTFRAYKWKLSPLEITTVYDNGFMPVTGPFESQSDCQETCR